MAGYAARRLLLLIPTVLLTVSVVFTIFRLVPGDPAMLVAGELAPQSAIDEIRRQMGLDQPLWRQYVVYMSDTVRGNLGVSKVFGLKASTEIAKRLPKTLKLSVTAMGLAILLGIPAGVLAAVKRNTLFDYVASLLSIFGICVPSFWLGLMLIIGFSVQLKLLPSIGSSTLAHLVLPAATLAVYQTAYIMRMTRSSVLEAIGHDYVRTARAKGLGNLQVIMRHVLRNALIPTVTLIGLQFGVMMGGAVVVETVFSWPGLGLLLIDSVRARDYTMVQAVTLVFSAMFLLINLAVDLTYTVLDPRIHYA